MAHPTPPPSADHRDSRPPKPLNDRDAADYLGLRPQTLRAWRCDRRGPAYIRIGRCVRYLPRDLDAFLEAGRVEGGEL